MMNLLKKECDKQNNISITENGAVGYKSTHSALVDMNYKVSSLRQADEDEIISLFDAAFNESTEYALKWLFFSRDILEGLGERRLFRICYRRLFALDEALFYNNLHNIPQYGRWDDLIALLDINDDVDQTLINIIRKQLQQDESNTNQNKPISLLAKWLPSENASSLTTKKTAKKIRTLLNMTSKEYRKLLSKLRAYSDVTEVKMCHNQWSDIHYDKVPSLANLRYANAFMKHDEARRAAYLDSVKKGTTKMNMQAATPVDVVSRYGTRNIRDYDKALELAWVNLKDIAISDTLVVADGSGSMTVPVSNSITALDVANALAIYTSEHNEGIYRNKYITFSRQPQFVEFSDKNNLREKLITAREHSEISNTNIEAVFDLILHVAIVNHIPQDEMIKNILIISDMEFDAAQRVWFWEEDEEHALTEPLFDAIKQKYQKAGYLLPKLIFWNVNSRTHTIPLLENELGVTLVSGFSQNVLKMIMSNKHDAYEVLIETITSERYDSIVCK